MPFLDGKPVIITKRNVDKHGNPISVKQIETKQVADIHNCIPLNYSIDRNHPIVIMGMYQTYNKDRITQDTFFADYDQGILYFHPTKVGKSLTITYMGTGYILISSDRIFRYNKINGVSTTESIEATFEKLENILNSIIKDGGGCDTIVAEVVASRTEPDGTTHNSLGDRLDHMSAQLSNILAIYTFTNTVNITGDTTEVQVNIPQYDPKTDLLCVYLAGVKMIEGLDYSLDKDNKIIKNLKDKWINGDQLYFEVMQKGNDTTVGSGANITVSASNVKLDPPVFNANDVQTAINNINDILKTINLKDYLPLAGGTMTGDIKFNMFNKEGEIFKIYNGTAEGHDVRFGGGGATIVAAGEGYTNIQAANNNEEVLYLASDREIKFHVNYENIGNQKVAIFDNNLAFKPEVDSTGSIGTNDLKWDTVYANTFNGNLSGNATTASRLNPGASINGVHFDGSGNINIPTTGATVSLAGYQKPGVGGSVNANDTLNGAIGKLEVNLDGKANSVHTHNYAGSNAPGGDANSAVKLATARDITIGNKTEKFDGTQGATWTLDDIGASPKVHTHTPANIIQDANNRFVTDADKTNWNNKETTQGSQQKANTAETNAKAYADEKLVESKAYTDQQITDCKAHTKTEIANLVNSAPEALDTLKELADALGNDPNFAATVATQIGQKADKTYVDGELGLISDELIDINSDLADKANTTDVNNALNLKADKTELANGLAGKADLDHNHDNKYVVPTGNIVADRVATFSGTTGRVIKDSGFTIATSVPPGALFTDTNTWRGVQDNLTSNSTDQSLSANQGRILKGLVDGKADATHTHTSNQINAMTGYVKGTNATAITPTDNLNTAIGKLERILDDKSNNGHTHNYLPLTGGQVNGNITANTFIGGLQGNATSSSSCSGNSATASRLQNSVNIGITGDGTGSIAFNGSASVNIPLTLANVNRNDTATNQSPAFGGTFTAIDTVTTDVKGRVTGVRLKTITLPNPAQATDTQVTNTPNNTTRAYITGTTNVNQSTGTQIFDTGVYLTTNQGELQATRFVGALQGNATSSTTTGRLATPRTITLTGDVTGNVSFDGSGDVTINTTVNNPGASSLKRDNKRVNINNTTKSVTIGVAGFDSTTQILNVYLSGVRLLPDVDYTYNNTTITTTQDLVNGDVVDIEVIRAV